MGRIKENMIIDQERRDAEECERLDQRLRDLLRRLEALKTNRQNEPESAEAS